MRNDIKEGEEKSPRQKIIIIIKKPMKEAGKMQNKETCIHAGTIRK